MKSRKKRTTVKPAVLFFIFYFAAFGLVFGMLRAAQKTRQILYGGQPVPAHVNVQSDNHYQISLGGGEWNFLLDTADNGAAEQLARYLPPCMVKWILQIFVSADNFCN